jgi:hypothetical protein
MVLTSAALYKGEAVHAPSPLQQEPERASKRQKFKAVWSEATKLKWLLLRRAVDGAQAPYEIAAIDPHEFMLG